MGFEHVRFNFYDNAARWALIVESIKLFDKLNDLTT